MNLCLVIPAWNEEKGIAATILSCFRAGLRPEDVYVLDDGSKDGTSREANLYKVNVLSEKNIGKEANIKRGLAHYALFDRYEFITILDADSILHEDYVNAVERAAKEYPGVAAIAGAVRSQKGNWLTAYRATETFLSTNIYREAQHFIGAVTVAPGCSTTYNCAKFRTLDFDGGTLVEDMDWTVQFHRRGDLVIQAMDAIIFTQDPATIGQLWGQVQRWHRGTWQVVRLRKLCRPFFHWNEPLTKIDTEFAVIIGEAMLFGAIMMLLPLWAYLWPMKTLKAILADQAILFLFVLLTAKRDKRWDVLYTFPLYIIPRVVSYLSFMWAFVLTRKADQSTVWFRPERW